MDAVIGAFQPAHRPPLGQTIDNGIHQVATRYAGAT